WTYFGPGIWHDPADGRVHLRLSPTTNQVAGLADYDGPADPHQVAIALWARSSTPLRIEQASYVEIRDLTVMGGGDETIAIAGSAHVVLDHVNIDAATMGLTIASSTAVRFVDGHLDGGIPSWSFRSDFKDNYQLTEPDGTVAPDDLV